MQTKLTAVAGLVERGVRPVAWTCISWLLNPRGEHFSHEPTPSFPLRLYDQAALDAAVAAECEKWRELAQRVAHQGNARGLEGLVVRCTISDTGAVVSWEVDRGPNVADKRRGTVLRDGSA